MRTNLGDLVPVGPDHPLSQEGGRPSVRVRGGLHARIARPVYYQLADMALEEGGDPPGLWSEGVFFGLGEAA